MGDPLPVDQKNASDALSLFHKAVQEWFRSSFGEATEPQKQGWPTIAKGESTLILAPTGTGKTLTAFLWCLNRLMFDPVPEKQKRCRVLYISPIKALAVDVERNLRAPLIGITHAAERMGVPYLLPEIAVRTGDTPAKERVQFQKQPSDVLITTPESFYLLLTSNAREVLRSIDTVIIDEIHALVPTKRGAHLALSLERLERLCGKPLQRIGLSATQRPLEEVARYLGGAVLSIEQNRKEPELLPQKTQTSERENADPLSFEEDPSVPQELAHEFEDASKSSSFRPVSIVAVSQRKQIELTIEVPVEDMKTLAQVEDIPSGPASQGPKQPSIWTAIYPKLFDLISQHQTTLIFVNSRRAAERLAAALNDLAGDTLVRAHHGSLALPQRREVEDKLKMGKLRGLVATSSLELGIDMGTIDLVVQIEAPPSVASGMQRIGRANHQVGAVSRGIFFPKFRADLVACAAMTKAMHEGQIESIRYPRNPLDVLAQQIVAIISMDTMLVDELFLLIRQAAPYVHLSRTVFETVLDMLSGRYPSDEFAELRPRLTWDRVKGTLQGRQGAKKIAISNAGTIPDRGLYGVFLAGQEGQKGSARVGELDEEMVHESHVGDTFLLGASTWRIEEITHDRVLVSPAPGEPGKMPFWKADMPGRPLEFGETIGKFVREIRVLPEMAALQKLRTQHDLDQNAAENLLRYLRDQAEATQIVPDDQTILIERYKDELGDFRICVMSPFGSQIHIPWCMAVIAKIRNQLDLEVETIWSDDGFVVRLPDMETPPDPELFLPDPEEVEELVLRQLGSSSLFAARFRENAGRALLLPKRRPGIRAPLWQQRKRAADLLAVASRYGSFPILLETYRECLRDMFDIPSLVKTLKKLKNRTLRIQTVDSKIPSPFASALLFSYVATFLYDGDAPLAERRAQALSIDQSQLKELLGDVDLRDVLEQSIIDEVESQLQAKEGNLRAKNIDGVHDILLRLGDLTEEELAERCISEELASLAVRELVRVKRIIAITIKSSPRYIAIEDAARYRDAFGVPLPPGLPQSLLESGPDPLLSLVRRFARTHGPFSVSRVAERFGISSKAAEAVLKKLHAAGRLVEGEFRSLATQTEYCEEEVLRLIRRKSLAKLRKQIEPVEQRTLGRFLSHWQGILHKRRGLDAVLDAIHSLQGVALPISLWEQEILPARVQSYQPGALDTLLSAGEILWCGVEPLGEHDGRVSFFLTDEFPLLSRLSFAGMDQPTFAKMEPPSPLSARAQQIQTFLQNQGASFFSTIHDAVGGGYAGDTLAALWELVWQGKVTNDTFQVLRALTYKKTQGSRSSRPLTGFRSGLGFRSRRAEVPKAGQGRWSLLLPQTACDASQGARFSMAWAQQLLQRYGVVTREATGAEEVYGGFSSLYPILKTLEESGKIRRGWFVAGLGVNQFAQPAAVDLLRSLREEPETLEVVSLAAVDPANPYGTMIPWPKLEDKGNETAFSGAQAKDADTQAASSSSSRNRLFARSTYASVILVNGTLSAYLRRRNPEIWVFLPEEESVKTKVARVLAKKLAELAQASHQNQLGYGTLITLINNRPAKEHELAGSLEEEGFVHIGHGLQMRRPHPPPNIAASGRGGYYNYQRFQSVVTGDQGSSSTVLEEEDFEKSPEDEDLPNDQESSLENRFFSQVPKQGGIN